MRRLGPLVLAALCVACAGAPRASGDLRAQLASDENAAARERAPDLVAAVESALDAADVATAAGDSDGAADHLTRARLYLQAAQAEVARITDAEARLAIEGEVAETLARARRDEAARAEISGRAVRAEAVREAQAAMEAERARAETDEGRGARRPRVSLEETADLRRGAAALRAHARLSLAAALSLGATAEECAASRDRLTESEAARDPMEALSAANAARRAALVALGAARSRIETRSPAELVEAGRTEGLTAQALDTGTALEVEGVFASGTRLSRAGEARLARLAGVVLAHPSGPVQIQVQAREAGRGGDRIAQQRAEAVVRALVAAGVGADRLEAQGLPSALASAPPVAAVRAVFVAYTP